MANDVFGHAIATGATIDDYLVSLAAGVSEAQRRLNALSTSADGPASPVAYQIPKLEFELRMTLAMQSTTEPEPQRLSSAGALASAQLVKRQLRFQTATSSTQSSIASTLRGSIVAVPTSGGRPTPRLDVTAVPVEEAQGLPSGASAVLVLAEVSNAAGEVLEGEEVQFNVDRELSAALNAEEGRERVELDAGTTLFNAVVRTDGRGLAGTQLIVQGTESPGTSIAVTVDAVQRTRTVIWRVPGA